MTQHHRTCDEILADAESPLAEGNWSEFSTLWQSFTKELLHHLAMEEETLFPAFEQATGMTQGPTQVMRAEHAQMRNYIEQMADVINEQQQERAMGLIESLMLLIQQHNMKEEQILYPMCDQRIPDSNATLQDMQNS